MKIITICLLSDTGGVFYQDCGGWHAVGADDEILCLIYEILHNIVRNISSGSLFWPIYIPRVLLFSPTALNFNVCIKTLVCVC